MRRGFATLDRRFAVRFGGVAMYEGSCHCRAVRFSVEVPESVKLYRCNCSICAMTGYLHLIVPKSAVRFISGEDRLKVYQFNTGVAKHLFCEVCGIKPLYVPRSHPDRYSVHAQCVTPSILEGATIVPFDGQNWEAAAAARFPRLG